MIPSVGRGAYCLRVLNEVMNSLTQNLGQRAASTFVEVG